MALLPILRFPDPRLKAKSLPVEERTEELKFFLDELVQTLLFYPGCVGLAAPQVGRMIRAIAVDASRYRKQVVDHHGLQVLLNPVILESSSPGVGREGCLSVSDYTGNVMRHQRLLVEGLNPQGQKVRIKASGFEAIVFQHEMDHLDGFLFLDRVSSLKTDVFRRKSYLH